MPHHLRCTVTSWIRCWHFKRKKNHLLVF